MGRSVDREAAARTSPPSHISVPATVILVSAQNGESGYLPRGTFAGEFSATVHAAMEASARPTELTHDSAGTLGLHRARPRAGDGICARPRGSWPKGMARSRCGGLRGTRPAIRGARPLERTTTERISAVAQVERWTS